MDLIIVENIDTGWTTLHRADCVHALRANITHPANPFWLAAVDRTCKVCHAEAPHSSKQI